MGDPLAPSEVEGNRGGQNQRSRGWQLVAGGGVLGT